MHVTSSRTHQIDPALSSHSNRSSLSRDDNGPSLSSIKDTPTKEPKTRTAITELERKSLRDYAHSNPTILHKELATWFESTFSHRIAQSSISDSLGKRFAYLDDLSIDELAGDGVSKRRRDPSFPSLERRLTGWFDGCVERGEQVNGELVKTVAAEFWLSMDEYTGREMPKWSNGWLEGWKQRNGINFKAHLPESERVAERNSRSEIDDQIEREVAGAKKRKTARTQQTASGPTSWDMLRDSSGLQSGEVEAWDMLRPVATPLREPRSADSGRYRDGESSSSPSPVTDPDMNRPGYDPSMPAWLRFHTWDELPWVKDGSMGLPKGKARRTRGRKPRLVPREGKDHQKSGRLRTTEQQNLAEPEAQAGSAEQPIALDAPTPLDIYHGNPFY